MFSVPGYIEFDNFVKLCVTEWGELPSEDLLKEAFRVFDISNCGRLPREHVKRILVGSGLERLTDDEGKRNTIVVNTM